MAPAVALPDIALDLYHTAGRRSRPQPPPAGPSVRVPTPQNRRPGRRFWPIPSDH